MNKKTTKKTTKKKVTKAVTPQLEDLSEDLSLDKCEKVFSVSRESDGWYLVTNFIKDDKLIERQKIGPNLRAIVIDEFKIEAQKYLEKMEL